MAIAEYSSRTALILVGLLLAPQAQAANELVRLSPSYLCEKRVAGDGPDIVIVPKSEDYAQVVPLYKANEVFYGLPDPAHMLYEENYNGLTLSRFSNWDGRNEYLLEADRTHAVYLSADNRFFVVSPRADTEPARLIKVPPRSKGVKLVSEELPTAATFPGRIMAATDDLNFFVVDRNASRFKKIESVSSYSYLEPDLVFVRRKGSKLIEQPLPEWNKVLERIRQAAPEGMMIRALGVEVRLTQDGSYAAVNLTFHKQESLEIQRNYHLIGDTERNWVGLWDMLENRFVHDFTSSDMDSTREKEARAYNFEKEKLSWDRRFAWRLTEDGKLFFARAQAERFNGKSASIVLKFTRLLPDQPPKRIYQLTVGRWRLRPDRGQFDLGTSGGISKLEIGTAGNDVIIGLSSLEEVERIRAQIPLDEYFDRL